MAQLVVDGRDVSAVEVAGTYLRRLRGMLGRRRLPPALLLFPGASVHGIGMPVRLDVAQLVPRDATGRCRSIDGPHTVRRTAVLRPFGLLAGRRGVCSVLEAPPGSFQAWGLTSGSVVEVVEGVEGVEDRSAPSTGTGRRP